MSTTPIEKATRINAVFPSIFKNLYFYSCPAVRFLHDTDFEIESFVFRSGPHRLPWQHNIWTQCVTQQQFSSSTFFIHQNFWGGGGFFKMFFCIVCYLFFSSLFSPPFLSIYPSLTFIWKNIPDALLSFSETWCLFSAP